MADKTNGSPASKTPGGMNKKEAVRRALQHLGYEAKPLQIREHIKKRYHMEMGLDHISTTKSEIRRESGQAEPTVAKSPAQQPTTPKLAIHKEASAKAAMPQGDGVPGISLTDIETVKDLVERVGATSLKKLIDVMAR